MSIEWNIIGLKNWRHVCPNIKAVLKTDAKLCPFCGKQLK